MPIYEYQCKKCGHISEFLEKMGDKKEHVCEKCGSRDVQKIYSTFATKSDHTTTDKSSCPTGTCPLS